MKYENSEKPDKCPSCKSKRIATILYGMVEFSPELDSDLKNGKIVLGGCVISDDDPAWKCKVCNVEIFRKSQD